MNALFAREALGHPPRRSDVALGVRDASGTRLVCHDHAWARREAKKASASELMVVVVAAAAAAMAMAAAAAVAVAVSVAAVVAAVVAAASVVAVVVAAAAVVCARETASSLPHHRQVARRQRAPSTQREARLNTCRCGSAQRVAHHGARRDAHV